MNLKENKGVTLIALMITIIVLLIIAGIAIYNGKETIQNANLEALRTNMLLIEAKAKGIVEEANFQLGPQLQKAGELDTIREKIYKIENKMEKYTGSNINIPTGDSLYVMKEETYSLWGLHKVYEELDKKNGEEYIISFDERNATVEIYNTLGYQGNYSLTQIDDL